MYFEEKRLSINLYHLAVSLLYNLLVRKYIDATFLLYSTLEKSVLEKRLFLFSLTSRNMKITENIFDEEADIFGTNSLNLLTKVLAKYR